MAVGGQVTLTSAVNANPAATAQWYSSTDNRSFALIPGATSANYNFTAPTAGVEYFQVVYSNSLGSRTSNSATATIDVPPNVGTNPSSAIVNAGQSVTFAVAATGTPAPRVQWQVSVGGGPFTNITAAHSLALKLTVRPSDNGNQYRAVFTNSVGTVETNPATLTVNYAPEITSQPVSQTVAVSSQVNLASAVSANPAAGTQWYSSTDGRNFNLIAGANTPDYSFTAPATAGGEYFRVVFSNTLGSQTSNMFKVIEVPPSITANPVSTTATTGTTVTFSAAATGTAPLSVQWQVSSNGAPFTNIASARSNRLIIVAKSSADGDLYHAVFTNAVGSAETSSAELTVTG
jgi:hypothetical protein